MVAIINLRESMRRRIGKAHRSKQRDTRFKEKGAELGAQEIQHVQQAMTCFKSNLEVFAKMHRNDIRKNPQFRAQFQAMCSKMGVDPLASNKGFWSELLGVGDFYYELSVQIMDICLGTRDSNGGLISLDELVQRLHALRGKSSQSITIDDVKRAVVKVRVLGEGLTVVHLGTTSMVVSLPCELNRDHESILVLAREKAFTTIEEVSLTLLWSPDRALSVLNLLMEEGLAWIDTHEHTRQYWFPGIYMNTRM